jgi:hypothetical protein
MAIARPPVRRLKPTGPRLAGGAPIYTREQFALVRPKGNYDSYKRFVSTRRGLTSGPAYPGRGGPGLPTYMSLLQGMAPIETPAQLEARARRMTADSIAAQRGMMLDESKRAQDDAMKRAAAMAAAGRAAASLNAGLFGQVGGEYNAAAQEMSGMATNLAGAAGTATAQDVANINTALGRVGAPGVEATGAMAGPGQAAVEAYRGGTLPAQNLVTQGQSAQFGLAGLVAAQNLRATQESNAGLMKATGDIETERASAMRELARGRPELAAKYLQQLQDSQRQQVALQMSLIGARRGALQKGFEQSITKQTVAQDIKESNAQIQAANAKIEQDAVEAGIDYARIDSAASRVAGYLIDKAGRPILGKNGKPIPIAKSARAGGASGLTANQAVRQIEKAQRLAETLFYGYRTDASGKRVPATEVGGKVGDIGAFDPDDPDTYGTGYASWPEALRRVKQLGVPHAQAVQILSQYYERGDQGRPMLSNPERTRIISQMVKGNQSLLSGPPAPGSKMTRKKAVQEMNSVIGMIQRAFNSGNADEGERLLSQLEALLR